MFPRVGEWRPSERVRAWLAFAALLLVVGSYTIVKSVRDAVFLSQFSVTQLSLVAVGLAVLSGSLVSIYLRYTTGVARSRLVVGSYVAVALTLLGLAFWLHQPARPVWLPWLLYIWSSVFGVFIVMQFWLLASELFDVREAKRVFGFVTGGAVGGGLLGGLAARGLSAELGAVGLLVIAAVTLLAASAAAHVLGKSGAADAGHGSRSSEPSRSQGLWSLMRKPSFVRQLALGLLLSTTVTTLLDWQLKAVAKHTFASHANELAGFFGAVYAYTSAGSLCLQLLFTSRLLQRYGVGVARAVLPLTLMLGFTALLGSAVLPVSLLALLTAARLSEGSVRYAIHQPATELSWLPLPPHERSVGKSFVDIVGDRLGMGVAGLIWVGFSALVLDDALRVHALALICIALVAAWLLVLYRTQQSYVAAIRSALAGRAVDLEGLWQSLGQAQTRQTIVDALASGDRAQVTFSLYLLEGWNEELPDLSAALAHPEREVRLQALGLLAAKSCAQQWAAAVPCLSDPDIEVREAAIAYLRRTAPDAPDPLLSHLLRDDRQAPLATQLDDPDDAVVEAAIRAAGRARAIELVPALAAKLGQRRWRARAIGALAELGSPALRQLMPLLRDTTVPTEVRRAIVRLAGAARDPESAPALATLLDDVSAEVAGDALRALARLRNRTPIALDAADIRSRTLAEANMLWRDLLFLDAGAWPTARELDGEADFLRCSIRDAANTRVERIFRLLSLIYAPADIRSAYRGLKSPLRATRSRSIDFLDHLLDAEVKRVVLPALEDADASRLSALARSGFGLAPEPRAQAIQRFLHGDNAWLRQVAAWDLSSQEEKTMGLSEVEKALKLRTVDVLARVSSEELAYIANIAEEVELAAGTPIYGHGDAPDALYVVVSGTVRLHQDGEEIGILGSGEAFGSWALFDETPRVASAAAEGPVTLLKVDREEFLELLGDRIDLVRSIFRAMVERIRSLAELAQQR